MTGPLRVGLVGAGAIAQVAELPSLAAHPEVKIAGLATSTPERARRNLERWPIERAYADLDEMLSAARLDALFVLTPKHDHTRFVEAGLRAGLDVFCEKPLATSLDEARRMAALADETGRLLMVGFNRRYAEVYARARAEFRERQVQFCVAQKNRPGTEYRATLENAIHMVDLLRWFCGDAEQINAHAIAPDPYHETGTASLIRFSGGAVALLMAARCAGEWDERLDVYGDLTSVRVVAPDSVAITRDGETTVIEMRPRAMGWAQATQSMGFAPEVDHFVECVRERRQPLTNGADAVRTQELMEALIAAAGLPVVDEDAAR